MVEYEPTDHGGIFWGRWARMLLAAALLTRAGASAADGAAPDEFALHGQFTFVQQDTTGFNAPYRGANSLSSNSGRETMDATLFAGARLWRGAELWANAELDQGFGLDDTLGVAGFPSAEAYKVGKNLPYLRLTRLFVRDTLNLEGEREAVAADINQFAGERGVNRWVFTVGKFSVVDVFDTNRYAHDPKGDFLNWAAVDAGSFDYAADAWGYTVGAAAEWYQGPWALRSGLFVLSDVPNSTRLEPGFHEFQWVEELERRYAIGQAAGKVMVTAFLSRGRMALLDEATAQAAGTGEAPVLAPLRRLRDRAGVHLSLEQQLTPDLGLFARIGKAAGNVEAYEFTDIDRSVSAGVSLAGTRWGRAADKVAIALLDDNISAGRQQYLNAGGLGVLVGDGKLPHPGPEEILETFYDAAVWDHVAVGLDYQFIEHPAYNRDRGPVSVWAIRLHAEF